MLFPRPFTRQANVLAPSVPLGEFRSLKPPLQIWFPAGSKPIRVSAATPRIRVYLSPLIWRDRLYILRCQSCRPSSKLSRSKYIVLI